MNLTFFSVFLYASSWGISGSRNGLDMIIYFEDKVLSGKKTVFVILESLCKNT